MVVGQDVAIRHSPLRTRSRYQRAKCGAEHAPP
jgi:hypothetical protein